MQQLQKRQDLSAVATATPGRPDAPYAVGEPTGDGARWMADRQLTTTTSIISAIVAAMSSAGWTIGIIAILIVAVIAWNEFDGKEELERLRSHLRRRGPSDAMDKANRRAP